MKKILSLFLVGIFGIVGIANAVSVFNSNQVGTNPLNGSVLQTNGTISTWVTTSSLGISGSGGSSTSIFAGNAIGVTASGTNGYIITNTGVTSTLGNWIGTWQGVNSSTFYLSSNPNGYTSSTVFFVNGINGVTTTFAGVTSNVSLNLGTGCSGGNFVQTISPTGTITCATPVGGSSTQVFAGTGIGVAASGTGYIVSNTGVSSIVAGTNVTISNATGTVTINSSGSGSSNNATGTNSEAAFFNATNTLSSAHIVYLPTNFNVVGAAGSSTATTLQAAIEALSQQQIALGQSGMTLMITKSVTSTWTNNINLNHNGFPVSIECAAGVQLQYTGAGNSSTSLQFNFGNPTGHWNTTEGENCLFMGHSSLIAAGQTNTATTTGIYFGGNQGAVGINFVGNVNGFGRNVSVNSNAYMDNFLGTSSGGNGGGMTGDLMFYNSASNSGERNILSGGTYTDPGNTVVGNDIYITNAGTASNFFTGNSIDDAQIYAGASDGQVVISYNHFENSDCGAYGAYIPIINPSSDQSTQLTVVGNEFANDCSGGNSFTGLIKHGGQLVFQGNHLDNYAGGTVGYMVDHSNDNGVESEMVCENQAQGGTVTNLINGGGNVTYSLANGNACWIDNANSYPIALVANQNNVNNLQSGNTTLMTFDHSANFTIGASGGTVTIPGNILVDNSGNKYSTSTSSGGGGFGVVSQATSTDVAFYSASSTVTGTSTFTFIGGSTNATSSFILGATSSVACIAMIDQTNSSTFYYTYWKGGRSFTDTTSCL